MRCLHFRGAAHSEVCNQCWPNGVRAPSSRVGGKIGIGPATQKEAGPKSIDFMSLASVELDHLLFLEELGKVLTLRQSDNLAAKVRNVRLHVNRHGRTLVVVVAG